MIPENVRPHLQRLIVCLFGGWVFTMMWGQQEGSQTDFGSSYYLAMAHYRWRKFLIIALVVFLLITFWRYVAPYIRRPGMAPLLAGAIALVASFTILNWYDPLGALGDDARFGGLRNFKFPNGNLAPFAAAYLSWLAYALLIGGLVLGIAAAITRIKVLGYLCAVTGIVGAFASYSTHSSVGSLFPGIDHSYGFFTAIVGFLVLGMGGIFAVYSTSETAETRKAVDYALHHWPGLLVGLIGVVLGLLSFIGDGWYAPAQINATFSDTKTHFAGQGLAQMPTAYLSWLGITLFAVCAVLALAGSILRNRMIGWAALVAGVVSTVITLLSVHLISQLGTHVDPLYGKTWGNMGAGGWAACMAFSLFAGTGVLVATSKRLPAAVDKVPGAADEPSAGPVTSAVAAVRGSTSGKTLLLVAAAIALFFPPTLTSYWQNTIITQIGVYVLLAVGLNVVVGWAGLLDLGYIAFYGIGSYTTAYFTGSLPLKPPSWLTFSPLWAIPFAIGVCLLAGLVLGAPTLRLRGDYLAIVTLGFGEIMQRVAVNNPGNLTGGPQGPHVPHPTLNLGFLKIHWGSPVGSDNLPYWYLLLLMLVIITILFFRIEGSRLGRAWAAIREDEVAAQATGINTSRVKLLAFAIGASTSGIAGVFFASQVGYFDPSLFSLQASVLIVAYVVFGGMGSLPGAMAGAAVLTWLPQFLKSQVPSADQQMWVGALLLMMMIFRPEGLIPAKRRKAELEGLDAPASSETFAVPAAGAL